MIIFFQRFKSSVFVKTTKQPLMCSNLKNKYWFNKFICNDHKKIFTFLLNYDKFLKKIGE